MPTEGTLKLLVNVESLAEPLTGVGHYTRNVLARLLIHPEVTEVRGLGLDRCLQGERLQAYVQQSVDVRAPIRVPTFAAGAAIRALLRRIPGARALKHRTQGDIAARCVRGAPEFVYWEPNFLLRKYQGQALVTIHDLSHLRHPEYHPSERVKALRGGLARSLDQAAAVSVVSEFTRRELADCFDLDGKPVHVIHPGVGPEFQVYPRARIDPILTRYGIGGDYLLSVGTLEPRKNLIALMSAYGRLPAALRTRYPLLLIGRKGWLTHEIETCASRLEQAGHLRWLGYVPQVDLPFLYAGATALAYVSLYEGFGMPVAEAMASGTPALISRGTAVEEVGGEAVSLADPHRVADIAQGLERLLADPDHRDLLARRGLERARRFTWERSAQAMLGALVAL